MLVNRGDVGPAGLRVFRLDFRMFGISCGVDEVVLRPRNPRLNAGRLVDLIIEVEALDDVLDERTAVGGVVNGEIPGVIDALGFRSQDAGEHAVKRAHPDVLRFAVADDFPDPLLHFARGFVRERQGQNRKRIHSTPNQIGNPVRQHPCFPGSRPGDDHHRTVRMGGGCALRLVQFVQEFHDTKLTRGFGGFSIIFAPTFWP